MLGRVLGVISFVHRGSHATGLLLVAPIFAIAAARADLRRRGGRRGRSSAWPASRSRPRPRDGGSGRGPDAQGLAVEQAELEHVRRVEAVDPQDRARRRDRGARGHEADELRADHLGPARRRLGVIRATISCSAAASQSSTFIDTCTSPRRGSSSPSARTPGKPPPRSRTTAAISRAASSGPRRFTLNAISGLRAPTRTAPADGIERAGPKSGASSPASTGAAAPRHRPAGRTPGRGAGGA